MNQEPQSQEPTKKSFFHLKNILIVVSIVALVVISVIGYFGYQFYSEIQLSQEVADHINKTSEEVNKYSTRYEDISASLESLSPGQTELSQIDTLIVDLGAVRGEIDESINAIQDGPVLETKELGVEYRQYLSNLKDQNQQVQILSSNAKCLFVYFDKIDEFGNSIDKANDNIALISSAYQDSQTYLTSLSTCLNAAELAPDDELNTRINNLVASTKSVYEGLDNLESRTFSTTKFESDLKVFETDSQELLSALESQFNDRYTSIETTTKDIKDQEKVVEAKLESIRQKYDLAEVS
jgi:hypothetical protein